MLNMRDGQSVFGWLDWLVGWLADWNIFITLNHKRIEVPLCPTANKRRPVVVIVHALRQQREFYLFFISC